MMARLGVFCLWLLHFLPLPVIFVCASPLGVLLYGCAWERRRVARINVRLCFPEKSPWAREGLVFRHIMGFTQTLCAQGVLWWGSQARIHRLVRVQNWDNRQPEGKPVIWLAPHFLGLDWGGARLMTAELTVTSMYSQQRNRWLSDLFVQGRKRFGTAILFSRQDGIRPIVKEVRAGVPFYYLPDQDYGRTDAVFAPFFGVPAATITGLSRIAKVARAQVVPCVTRRLPWGQGFEMVFYPAWNDFPSADVLADTTRMNDFIAEVVRTMPEQYFWLHKRFKTRPEGEEKLY